MPRNPGLEDTIPLGLAMRAKRFGVRWQAQRNTATWNAPPENITDNGMNKFIIVNPPAG